MVKCVQSTVVGVHHAVELGAHLQQAESVAVMQGCWHRAGTNGSTAACATGLATGELWKAFDCGCCPGGWPEHTLIRERRPRLAMVRHLLLEIIRLVHQVHGRVAIRPHSLRGRPRQCAGRLAG